MSLGNAVIAVQGILGWRNHRDEASSVQVEAYDSDGRWGNPAPGRHQGTGRAIVDALAANGGTEGDRLILLALPRMTPDAVVDGLMRDLPALVLERIAEAQR